MEPVGQGVVDVLALVGSDEGRDDEVDVGGEEEDCDGEGSFEGGCPGEVGVGAEVEFDEAEGDEGVYDGEGVGD